MIQKQTYLKVADNSGAKEVMCIHICGGTRKRYGRLGDEIIVAVKEAIAGGLVKKKEVCRAVIVRTRKENRREDGGYIRFSENAVVLLKDLKDKEGKEPIGSRIFGPVARELKDRRYTKIVSLAPEVV